MYKFLAKSIVARFAIVMGKLISTNHLTFTKGKQLVDGVVDMNDILDTVKKSKKILFYFQGAF